MYYIKLIFNDSLSAATSLMSAPCFRRVSPSSINVNYTVVICLSSTWSVSSIASSPVYMIDLKTPTSKVSLVL